MKKKILSAVMAFAVAFSALAFTVSADRYDPSDDYSDEQTSYYNRYFTVIAGKRTLVVQPLMKTMENFTARCDGHYLEVKLTGNTSSNCYGVTVTKSLLDENGAVMKNSAGKNICRSESALASTRKTSSDYVLPEHNISSHDGVKKGVPVYVNAQDEYVFILDISDMGFEENISFEINGYDTGFDIPESAYKQIDINTNDKINVKVPEVKAAADGKTVNLSWNDIGARSYTVFYKTASAEKYEILNCRKNSCSLKNLNADTEYDIFVKSSLNTLASEKVTVKTGSAKTAEKVSAAAVKLAAPTNIKATKSKDKITLKWNAVDGADAYRVFKYDASSKKYVKYKDVTKTACTVSGLKSGTKYQFKVAALDKVNGKYTAGTSSKAVAATTK